MAGGFTRMILRQGLCPLLSLSSSYCSMFMSLLYSRSMESRRFNGETMCRSVRQVFSEASLWVIRKVSISAPRA